MMTLTLEKPRSRYWQVFWLCLALSAALFLPHCIVDAVAGGGYFHYAGDFNDQQISFYQYANDFVKQGGTFSWATDLGSGFINSYSFYLVGSPFFWLSTLVPARWMPWCMVPLLCLKFALAGGGAYRWARRWVKDEDWSLLAGVLYAFSGFTVYNVFFNHFLDVVALFPYMLAALDDAVLDGRRGAFPFWVALNLINNYFFFAGQAVFLVIYFACMVAARKYRLTAPLFGVLAFETLLGCGFGCLLLVPAGLSLIQNPRTIDPFEGYGYLVYARAQQYPAIFYSAFLMPDAPYLKDLFQEGVLKHTSMTAYLPVVGIAGGLAFCRARRRHPFSYILKVCVLCAFVPVLNSAFYALNSSYYARWYYMPVLVLCAATAIALKSPAIEKAELPRAAVLCLAVVLSTVAFAVLPNKDDEGNLVLGVVDNQYRYWAIFAVSLLGAGLLLFLVLRRARMRNFFRTVLATVVAFSFVYGSVHLSFTKYGQWYNDADYVQSTWREAEQLKAALPDDTFYRLDAYECYNNMGLWLDKSCIQFFNSTVSPSIMEFYPAVDVTRDVNSKPKVELYALRGLLSVRYTLVPLDKEEAWLGEELEGWRRGDEVGSYVLYENENWVPAGFVVDRYLTQEDFESMAKSQRANLLLKAVLLDETQLERYAGLLAPLEETGLRQRNYGAYAEDCARCRENAVTSFVATRTGFTAQADLETQGLVLFSVPYDDGFAATVNGKAAMIEKVDNGLMAVLAPAGHSEIVFTYHTPGLRLSAQITACAAVVYAGYLGFLLLDKRRKRAQA